MNEPELQSSTRICAIVPAAGRSERFGTPKSVADIDGMPMLARVLGALRAAGIDQLVVVLGEHEAAIRERVQALTLCRVVINPRPERGMFSSIQEGFNAAAAADAYVVAVADMPFVRPSTVRALIEAHRRVGGVVSPRYRGKRGHPIVVDQAVREAILSAEPKPGFTLHDIIKAQVERRHDLDVDDPGVVRDVDTIADVEVVGF
jgi:molybdenum cofactor cytidylyltransferase